MVLVLCGEKMAVNRTGGSSPGTRRTKTLPWGVSTCSSFAGAVLSVAPGSGLGESPYRSVGRVSCLRGETAAWAKAFGGRVSRRPW
jgi:hypothetical protein